MLPHTGCGAVIPNPSYIAIRPVHEVPVPQRAVSPVRQVRWHDAQWRSRLASSYMTGTLAAEAQAPGCHKEL